jgi:predicted naringenin-chalcone synthase
VVANAGVVVGRGWAVPPAIPQDALWSHFFTHHYRGSALAERIFARSGVVHRHGVADPRVEDLSWWGTAARMERFVAEALPLAKEAVTACLEDAELAPAAVDVLAVASCTGYATPGLDVLLARDLGLGPATQRVHVGHMGCYAALPALATVADAAAARGRTGVLLCLELTSLHIQPATDDPQQMVAHALFSDAAAAVAVTPGGAATAARAGNGGTQTGVGLEVVDLVARTASDHAALMTWDVTDLGFRMGLSPQVPDVLGGHVEEAVADLLGAHGLGVEEVAEWAVHPGGPRIVDVVAERLGLEEAAVAHSRGVLADHGNCSSATVLLILDRILTHADLRAGDPIVALAFGPGLTLYAALLRVL